MVLTAGLTVSCFFLAAGMAMKPAAAESAGAGTPPFLCLNVQKVFQDYKKFQQLSENLKAKLEAKEKELMDMEQQIKGKADSIQQMQAQADRDNAQKEIQEMKFDYEKSRRDARQEFLTAEADMYATCYAEMYDLVQAYCKQHNYYVVLRLQDAESKDKSTPNKILQTLNREVVYSHPNLDLTQVITEGLNQNFERVQARGAGGGSVR
jgi:Skp family chaperone for outer membrane proteins